MVPQLSHSSNVKPSLRECPKQGWSFSCCNFCSQPEYSAGTCVSKTLKRRTPYWWKRQSEIQRQSCMTWSKNELSDKPVSNCSFFGAARSLDVYDLCHHKHPHSLLTFKIFLSSSNICNPFLKACGPRRKISNRKMRLFDAIYNKFSCRENEWRTEQQRVWK